MSQDISEILSQVERVEEYMEKFTVPAGSLKEALRDLKSLFRRSLATHTVEFELKGKKLLIRAGSGLYYLNEIETDRTNDTDISVRVLFKDITDILPGRGRVSLTFTPVFVGIEGGIVSATLGLSYSSVDNINMDDGGFVGIESKNILKGIRKILGLSTINKEIGQGNTIIFEGEFMQVRYSSIWIQHPSDYLETVMDFNTAEVLQKFALGTDGLYLSDTGRYLVFRTKNKFLAMTKSKAAEKVDLKYELNLANYIKTVNCENLTNRLNALHKVMGEVDVELKIYSNYIEIATASTENTVSIKLGSKSDSSTLLDRFTQPMAFMCNILSLVGDEFELYRRGGTVCLKSQNVIVIFS